MMLTIKEIRNKMLNCKPTATVSVEFCEDDVVNLVWKWVGKDGADWLYSIPCELDHLRTNCRVFERQIHKAKRFLKFEAEVANG